MRWLCLLVVLVGAGAQKPSPCPEVFEFESTAEAEVGKWTGLIKIRTDEELHGVWLHVSLDKEAHLLLNWFGDATSTNNKDFSIRNPSYRLEAGPPVTVRIQILYNSADAPPNLSRIRLNGRTICSDGLPVKPVVTSKPFISQSETRPPPRRPTRPVTIPTTTSTTIRTTPESTIVLATTKNVFIGDFANILVTTTRPTIDSRPIGNSGAPACGTVAKRGNPLITGGYKAKEGDWPWHVALHNVDGVQSSYICGAVLVSRGHVLTAAHCVTKPSTNLAVDPDAFLLYFGRTNLKKAGMYTQLRNVDKVSVHPEFNYTFFYNDVAVLKLSQDVDYSNFVRPVCLWSGGISRTIINKLGVVVGWGFDQSNKIVDELHEAQLPVVDKVQCIYSNPDFFNKFTSESSFCAGFRNGTSVCNGDSGGGMYFSQDNGSEKVWEVRGLVSISLALQRKFCDPGNYAVFSDLAYSLPWIQDRLSE